MIEVVEMQGAPYARSRSAGQRLKAKVRGHLEAWLASLERVHGEPGEGVARALVAETEFCGDVQARAPDLLEEVRGWADGAGVDRDLMLALQLLDEEWAWRNRRGAGAKLEKCSSLAIVEAGGPTWIGQNMDLGSYTDGFQAALRIGAHGGAPAALVFTAAGMIGLMGVNAAGVGVCVNSLPQLPSAARGVPVAFMVRRLLQASSLAEAAELVQRLPHATNQNYMLADPGQARAFEASAAGVNEYRPATPDRILHTNHPLAAEKGAPESEADRANSVARLAALTNRLGAGRADLEAIEAALSSLDDPKNPVSRMWDPAGGLIGFTTGSMISALRPGEAPRSWISAGPPHLRGYDEVRAPAAVAA